MTTFNYGYGFQIRLITALIKDEQYLTKIYNILDKKYFSSESIKWLIGFILDYYEEYKVNPSAEVIKEEILQLENDILKESVLRNFRDISKYYNNKDIEYVKKKVYIFCQNQTIKKAIIQSTKLLKDQKFEEIKTLINDSMSDIQDIDEGLDYIEEFDVRYNEEIRKTVATPWDVINNLTNGGLSKGEEGIVVGPTSAGKTWLLCALGAEAVRRGKNVIHFTLELSESYVGLRYDSIITKHAFQELKYRKDKIKEAVKKYVKGKLKVKKYPPTTATTDTLSTFVEHVKMKGFYPDMIIIDYGGILAPKYRYKDQNSYNKYGEIFEEIKGLADEYQVPIWTASQTNREGYNQDIVTGNKMADSFKKLFIADFVFSLSRKREDKVQGTARIHIIKNRLGPDGMTFNAEMNAGTGDLLIFDENSEGSKRAGEKMKDKEKVTARLINKRLQELSE